MSSLKKLVGRVALIQASSVIGICFLDEDGRLVQLFDEAPDLRETITNYYLEQIRVLEEEERAFLESKEFQKMLKRQRLVSPD